MSTWNVQQAQQLTAPQEVGVATRRRDGSVRTPRVIWIVRSGDRVFIRSTNGRGAADPSRSFDLATVSCSRPTRSTGTARHPTV